MFCRCRNGFGGEPNTQTCPVCLAFPGCAAGAEPARDRGDDQARARARLHDRGARGLPPQELLLSRPAEGVPDQPVRRTAVRRTASSPCRRRTATSSIGITRAHLEEDAAKNVHVAASGRLHGATATLVDFNRGGTPLVEIVTEPDLHDAETAKRFLQLLRQTVVELGLSDAELEKGSMRFDVNVSVRPAGIRRAAHAHRAEEHELVQLRGEGDRARDRAADPDLRGGRRGAAGDAAFRSRRRGVAAVALQGGGAGLPLLPRARSRAGASAGRARRAAARSRSASCPARGSAASPTRCRSTTPTCW